MSLAQGTDKQDHGEVRIAYSPLVDLHIAGELKKAIGASNPTLQLTFSGASTENQLSGILDGSYLAGLAVLPVTDAALATRVLLRHRLLAVLPTNHRLARKRQVEIGISMATRSYGFPRRSILPSASIFRHGAARRAITQLSPRRPRD